MNACKSQWTEATIQRKSRKNSSTATCETDKVIQNTTNSSYCYSKLCLDLVCKFRAAFRQFSSVFLQSIFQYRLSCANFLCCVLVSKRSSESRRALSAVHACLDKCWYLTLRKTLSEWTVYSFLFSRSLCNKNRQSKCFFILFLL